MTDRYVATAEEFREKYHAPRAAAGDLLAQALGADPEALRSALETALTPKEHDGADRDTVVRPAVPSVDGARALQKLGTPIRTEAGTVKEVTVRDGDPAHGARPSGAWVSSFEVTFCGKVGVPECPECGTHWRRFDHASRPHMGTCWVVACKHCGETIDARDP